MKKVSKIDPPLKTPKCQINGQNRHFVNSEPPGPAFFEFQGVPRDPVLRPKSTPLFLNGKCDHVFHIYHFYAFIIFVFYAFSHFSKVSFFVTFDQMQCLM